MGKQELWYNLGRRREIVENNPGNIFVEESEQKKKKKQQRNKIIQENILQRINVCN